MSGCGWSLADHGTMAEVPWRSCQQKSNPNPALPSLSGAVLGGCQGSASPSPEGVPELDADGCHPSTVTLHCGSGLTAEGAAGAKGEDGKELQERAMGPGGLRPWGDPFHPWEAGCIPWC